MRHTKRVTFATPFVLVVSAACGPGYQSGHNPPGPHTVERTSEQCEALKAGDACTGDESCTITRDPPCGVMGYQCRDAVWHENTTVCTGEGAPQ